MHLSRIALNSQNRSTLQALASPNRLHGAIEQSCIGEKQRNLWRIDWLGDRCYLLVLSVQRPDFTELVNQFGYPDAKEPWITKDYEPLLAKLQPGQVWRFRLCANPVHSSSTQKDDASGRGKVFAHVTQQQQRDWLYKRADACGFSLDTLNFDVVHTEWKKFTKGRDGNREVNLRTAVFEGVLTVTDAERFRQTLTTGIGKAKAYGCGLMTVVRYEERPSE